MRTDDDNWDITTSVGATALFVATARALEAQKPDPLANDPFAAIFCRAVGGSAADVLDGKNADHQLKQPDFGEHFVNFQGARTRYFDDYFRQQQLFTGIDSLASPGSHVAVEDGVPMPAEAFNAAVEAERAAQAEGDERSFFQLVYNERHAPAEQWFGERGWTAVATPLAEYFHEVGRPVPEPDTKAGPMITRNTLVRAVKQ